MEDLNGKKVLIGLSGGINSMAVLMWLIENHIQPSELHLYYAHFSEHSPDTFQFVADGIRYARKRFRNVKVKISRNSVLAYFEQGNMIPHPVRSTCSFWLKIEPMERYAFENGIYIDLVGYVKKELKRRSQRQSQNTTPTFFGVEKQYPIGNFDDDWCFEIVKKHLGWYPAIYDIIDEKGKRVFKHNNCLPCKNMYVKDMAAVKEHFPDHHERAMKTTAKIKSYWGRSEADFYAEFGRDLGQEPTCEACNF